MASFWQTLADGGPAVELLGIGLTQLGDDLLGGVCFLPFMESSFWPGGPVGNSHIRWHHFWGADQDGLFNFLHACGLVSRQESAVGEELLKGHEVYAMYVEDASARARDRARELVAYCDGVRIPLPEHLRALIKRRQPSEPRLAKRRRRFFL